MTVAIYVKVGKVPKMIEKISMDEASQIIKERAEVIKEKIYAKYLKIRYIIRYLGGYLLFEKEFVRGGAFSKTEYPLLKIDKNKAKEIIMYFINNKKANFEDLEMRFGIDIANGRCLGNKKAEQKIIEQYPKSLIEKIKEKQSLIREGKKMRVYWTKKEREFFTRLVNDRLRRGVCIFCGNSTIIKDGNHHNGGQAYRCLKCGRRFKENSQYIKFSLISF